MGWLAFIILGLIAGVIARIILPGRQRGGWILTLILGVLGALLGGWIASLLGLGKPTEFWSIYSWIVAIIGALIVIGLFNLIFRPKRA